MLFHINLLLLTICVAVESANTQGYTLRSIRSESSKLALSFFAVLASHVDAKTPDKAPTIPAIVGIVALDTPEAMEIKPPMIG